MARPKGIKNKKANVVITKEEVQIPEPKESIAELEKKITQKKLAQRAKEVKEALAKREALINIISSRLMSNSYSRKLEQRSKPSIVFRLGPLKQG